MSFLEHLQDRLALAPRGRGKATKTISHPPIAAEMKQVRPRADGVLVRAWRAQRTGELETGHGGLKYVAGRDWIVEHGPHDYAVVRGDIFERLYQKRDGDRYAKRTDVVMHYFTLPYRVRVRTMEGHQDAEAGDWIMQGVKGELWPVKPERAAAKYELIN